MLYELILPNSVPAVLNTISPPPASNLISSGASIVKSPLPLSVSVVALLPSPVIDRAPALTTKAPEISASPFTSKLLLDILVLLLLIWNFSEPPTTALKVSLPSSNPTQVLASPA